MNVLVDPYGHEEFTKSILVSFLLTFLVLIFHKKNPNVEQLDQPLQAVQQVLLVD